MMVCMSTFTNTALAIGTFSLAMSYIQKVSKKDFISSLCSNVSSLALLALGLYSLSATFQKADAKEFKTNVDLFPPQVQNVISRLANCPASKNLANPFLTGELKIQCLPKESFRGPEDAFINPVDRMISVPCEYVDKDLTSRILFEAINDIQRDKLARENSAMCNKTADQHASAMEKMEYETVYRHHEIAKDCVSQGLWPAHVDFYGNKFMTGEGKDNWNTLEGYLSAQEFNGHTDHIRKSWYSNCATQAELQAWMISKIPEWQARAATKKT